MSGLPQRGANGMGPLPAWADLEPVIPQIVATMRRYLTQIGCVLRPGSVGGAGLALRSFAGFLAQAAPQVTSLTEVTRRHIEDYKPWLAQRPGQNKPQVTTATLAHRLGTCKTCTFFQTSIEFRPTLAAQHGDAIARHQDHRQQLFASLPARTGQDAS